MLLSCLLFDCTIYCAAYSLVLLGLCISLSFTFSSSTFVFHPQAPFSDVGATESKNDGSRGRGKLHSKKFAIFTVLLMWTGHVVRNSDTNVIRMLRDIPMEENCNKISYYSLGI